MQDSPRFIIDLVADLEWQIFDVEAQGTPTVYLMYVIPVACPPFNYQLILTVFDGAAAAETTVPELHDELWSVHFYSGSGPEQFMDEVFDVMFNYLEDIAHPLEFALAFGGLVKNKRVVSARMSDTH
jgi:hypothetical protein